MKHFLAVVLAAALTGGVKASEMGVLRGHLKGRDENDFARRMTDTCTYPTIDSDNCDHSDPACFTLFAGQTIPVGEVCAAIVGTNLEVTYTVTATDWYLNEAHLWAGDNPYVDMPQTKKGSPIPGNFPHHAEYGVICPRGGASTHTFTIPLDGDPPLLDCCENENYPEIYIAAHAAVYKCGTDEIPIQEETGWSDGKRIVDKGNWGTMSYLCLTCGGNGGGGGGSGCETDFARHPNSDPDTDPHNMCFLDIDEDGNGDADDFHRWGWSNGPFSLDVATYILEIYGGAGQCDTTKGEHVGNLSVVVGSGGAVTVTYNALSGYEFKEFHLFVGTEILPRDNGEFTLAPGQYPYVAEVDPAETTHEAPSVTVSDVFYVVAHSVSCPMPET